MNRQYQILCEAVNETNSQTEQDSKAKKKKIMHPIAGGLAIGTAGYAGGEISNRISHHLDRKQLARLVRGPTKLSPRLSRFAFRKAKTNLDQLNGKISRASKGFGIAAGLISTGVLAHQRHKQKQQEINQKKA